jgi:hypothetical protein
MKTLSIFVHLKLQLDFTNCRNMLIYLNWIQEYKSNAHDITFIQIQFPSCFNLLVLSPFNVWFWISTRSNIATSVFNICGNSNVKTCHITCDHSILFVLRNFNLCNIGISIVSLYVWLFYNTSLLKGLRMPKEKPFPKIRLHHIPRINNFLIQLFTMLFAYIHQWISSTWIECACKIFFSYM